MTRRVGFDLDGTLFRLAKPKHEYSEADWKSHRLINLMRAYPKVANVLRELHGRGELVGAVTGRHPSTFPAYLQRIREQGLPLNMSDLKGYEPVGGRFDWQDYMNTKTNWMRNNAVTHYIGDQDEDRQAAEAAGAHFVPAQVIQSPLTAQPETLQSAQQALGVRL